MKRTFSICILICLSLMLFCSCESNTAPSDNSTNGTETEPSTQANEAYYWPEHIPDEEIGGEFRILEFGGTGGAHWSEYEFVYDENLQGDVLNDSIRTRDSMFEEKYGVKIVYNEQERSGFTDYIRRVVNSGSDDFDICVPNITGAATLASEGLFMNLYSDEIKGIIDFNADYWDKRCNDQLSIDHQLFFGINDLTLCDKQATWAVFFVKSVVDKYKLCEDVDNSIYSLVESGDWTITRMYEMVKAASHDINGDGLMTDQDSYGQIGEVYNLGPFMTGVGSHAADKDADDIPYYCWEDQIDVLTEDYRMVHDIVRNPDYSTHANALQNWGGYEDAHVDGVGGMMVKGLCLFNVTGMNRCYLYRELDCVFGIVPFPKHDKSQKEYYSMISYNFGNCVAIPITVRDFNRAATLLEAYTCIASQTSYKAYIEKALQYKYLRDDDSYEMLKILFNGRRMDITDVYGWGGGTAGVFTQDIGVTAVASSIKKTEKIMQNMIKKGLEIYRKNNKGK